MIWEEEESYTEFKIDRRFKRKLFSLGSFHLWEGIRVIQYKETDSPEILYTRAIGMNEKWIGIRYESNSNKILSFINKKIYWLLSIFNKNYRVNVKESKFLKYKFIRDCFPDIKRNEILEKLGI
jgi:hypothetical protein